MSRLIYKAEINRRIKKLNKQIAVLEAKIYKPNTKKDTEWFKDLTLLRSKQYDLKAQHSRLLNLDRKSMLEEKTLILTNNKQM